MSQIDGKQLVASSVTADRLALSLYGSDAFGRMRAGLPETLFDAKFLNDAQPLYWDDAQTSGGSTTSTFNANQASVTLAVANGVAGIRVRQTFRRFQYQPGKSQSVVMTGVIGTPTTGITRRIGLFDTKNGVFFESSPTAKNVVIRSFTSGSAVETRVAQSAWNIDKLDGTGASGLTLDFSKTNIFMIDFQWLGSGTVRFGFFINGSIYYCHQIHHANIDALVYMSTPNLPLRYEISNSGAGGAASMLQICSTVISEGGSQDTGATRSVSRGATGVQTLNTTNLYPLISIRLKSGFESCQIQLILASAVCTSNSPIEVQVLLNPTVAGTALSFASLTNSSVEADVTSTNATAVSGGTLLQSTILAAAGSLALDTISDFQIGSSIAGVNDIIVVAFRRLTGTTETAFASLTWRETN
jgi:hypothetical protein